VAVNEQLIRAELLKLQKEKERLHHEQEENARKEQLLMKELMSQQGGGGASVGVGGAYNIQGVSIPVTGQGKIMSGLVSSSTNTSGGANALGLPPHSSLQTSNISGVDPFLGQTMSGRDMHGRQNSGDSGIGKLLKPAPEFKVQSLMDSSLGLGDMSSFMDSSDHMGMDSEDLVSTLNDDISRELMGMDPQMMDSLLWL